MLTVAGLFWTACCGLAVAGPAQLLTWSKRVNPGVAAGGAAYYQLPMYRDVPEPLLAKELFQPLLREPGQDAWTLPADITALLLPLNLPGRATQIVGTTAVDTWCGSDQVDVRADRLQLRAWTVPSLFRLGTCPVFGVTPRYLYFRSGLNECGATSKVVDGQLVYTFILSYTPLSEGYITRTVPLFLPIHCHYNRFHYSFKVGFRPLVHPTSFLKSLRSKLHFNLNVCDETWEPLPPGHWFSLGEPIYFMAWSGSLLKGERLNVDSCYVTNSEDSTSMPRVDIIANYGCMTDSQREGSSSRFWSRMDNVIKFTMDSFLFGQISQMLYLHCSVSISMSTSHIAKSCSYNKTTGSWEDLEAPPSVCSCCDSICAEQQGSMKTTVSSPGWLSQESEAKPRMRVTSSEEEEEDWLDLDEDVNGRNRMEELLEKFVFHQGDELDNAETDETIAGKSSIRPAEEEEQRLDTIVHQNEMTEEIEGSIPTVFQPDAIIEPSETRPEEREMFKDSESLDSEYESLDSEYESLDSEYESLDSEYESLDSEYESLDSEYESLDSEYESLDPEYESLDPEYESLDPEFESLSDQSTVASAEVSDRISGINSNLASDSENIWPAKISATENSDGALIGSSATNDTLGDEMVNNIRQDAMHPSSYAEALSPDVRASRYHSSVNDSLEWFPESISDSSNLETDSFAFSGGRNSVSNLSSDNPEPPDRSANESLSIEFNLIPEQTSDPATTKSPDGLPSLQIRESESAHPVVICDAGSTDCDSGTEGEAVLEQLSGEVETTNEVLEMTGVGSDITFASSLVTYPNKLSDSVVGANTTTLQVPDSSLMVE